MGDPSQEVKLKSGHVMPQVGLGTWLSQPVGSVKTQPGAVPDAVKAALDVGYKHIDCAMAYGNQHEIGPVFEQYFGGGKLKREDVFITSKLWNVYHSTQKVSEGVDKILAELRIPYLDMLLIHWPQGYDENHGMFPKDDKGVVMYSDVDYVETWKAMEVAVGAGKVRSIGVSNFNPKQLERIQKEASIKLSNLQVEANPYFAQEKCLEYCKKRGIVMTAYSPLANNSHMFRKEGQPNLLDETVLLQIANTHKKSCTPSRIRENFQVTDFHLSPEEMAKVSSLDKGLRILTLDRDLKHPHYPFSQDF